ncbi:DNA replication protein [Burkholderiales bacterium JOSHI_001]|nr:DNA replication protein [Burkholderiales bacterium JOSHI_001]
MAASSENHLQQLVCAGCGVARPVAYEAFNHLGGLVMRFGDCPECGAPDPSMVEDLRAGEIDQALSDAGLFGRNRHSTFGGFEASTPEQQTALKCFREFAETARPGQWRTLLALGGPGTGKTHLAAGAVHAMRIQREVQAKIVSVTKLVAEVRATWRRASELSEDDVLHAYIQADALALDDVGSVLGEIEPRVMFAVVDGRYQRQRPTIITSNLTAPELQAALGVRTYDRLREASRVVVMDWPSHRGRA